MSIAAGGPDLTRVRRAATLYRHFPSKDKLVLAFLQLREQRWTKDFVEAGAISRNPDPEERAAGRSWSD